MLQEVNYLMKFCSSGDLAERAETNCKDRAGLAAMFLDRNCTDPRRGNPSLHVQCHSVGKDSQQGGQLLLIRDVRVLQIEALGPEIGEERLDGSSLPIGSESMLRVGRTSEGEDFAAVQTHDHKPYRWRLLVSRLTNFTPTHQDHFLSLAEVRCYPGNCLCGVSVAKDVLVLTKPKNKRDILLA